MEGDEGVLLRVGVPGVVIVIILPHLEQEQSLAHLIMPMTELFIPVEAEAEEPALLIPAVESCFTWQPLSVTFASGGARSVSAWLATGRMRRGASTWPRGVERMGGEEVASCSCSSILRARLIANASDWGLWISTSMLSGGWRPTMKSMIFCASVRVPARGSRAWNRSC